MSLALAGSLIKVQDLSAISRQALSLVDGGLQWLSWASNDTLQRYSFTDETSLVGAVQQGLHGTSLAYLPRSHVFVSPIKLMSIGLEDLQAISRWEANAEGGLDANQICGLLAAHDVIPCSELISTIGILQDLGVGDSPLFATMTLIEHVALREWSKGVMLQDEPSQRLAREAALFACKQARHVCDFMDYHRMYMQLAEREPAGSALSSDQRMQATERILQTLLPELFAYLDCPQASRLPSPEEVTSVVTDWLANGKSLGFSRLSAGVRQVVEHPSFRPDLEALPIAVRNYILAANQFFSRQYQLVSIMKQDGCTCSYRALGNRQWGELLLNADNVISLQCYQENPSSRPPEEQS
jgi:hypothetical protein